MKRLVAWIMMTLVLMSNHALGGEIHDAVNAGRIDQVERLIASDPKLVNEGEVHGWTPLSLAAASGYKAMVELLCKAPRIRSSQN